MRGPRTRGGAFGWSKIVAGAGNLQGSVPVKSRFGGHVDIGGSCWVNNLDVDDGERAGSIQIGQHVDNARTGTGVPAFGRALRAPVPPVQASAGLRPGTPCPSVGLRPALRAPNAGQCRPSGLRPALRAPSADQCRPCFRVPNAPSHRVHVQASAALPLPA